MEKESVIAFRDALCDNGDHRAIRIAFDNGINISLSSDLIIWDDDNERVVAFTADGIAGSFEAGTPIRIICSTYEHIQFIMSNTGVKIKNEYKENYKLEELEKQIDNLKSVVNITDDTKKSIISWFDKIYSPSYELSQKAYKPVDFRRGNELVKTKKD